FTSYERKSPAYAGLFRQPEEAETNWFLPLFGGDKRDRTADLLNAIYSPDMLVGRFHYRIDTLLPIDFTGKKGH
ncbi:hypothetical protein LIR33_14570, partial [Flavonifractor plautii]|uniref:hypothetical protein n=1 Tax=Flavonifractor plautii TaxID=292800 RepID=UPI001D003206